MLCDLSFSALDAQAQSGLKATPFHLAAKRKPYDRAKKASTRQAYVMAQGGRGLDRGLHAPLCSSHGKAGTFSICTKSKGAALMRIVKIVTAMCFGMTAVMILTVRTSL